MATSFSIRGAAKKTMTALKSFSLLVDNESERRTAMAWTMSDEAHVKIKTSHYILSIFGQKIKHLTTQIIIIIINKRQNCIFWIFSACLFSEWFTKTVGWPVVVSFDTVLLLWNMGIIYRSSLIWNRDQETSSKMHGNVKNVYLAVNHISKVQSWVINHFLTIYFRLFSTTVRHLLNNTFVWCGRALLPMTRLIFEEIACEAKKSDLQTCEA